MAQKTPAKCPLWLPYLQSMELKSGKKVIVFSYNGGQCEYPLDQILSIMLYGDSEKVDINILEMLGRKGIPVVIHRRNLANSIWIHSGHRGDIKDVLTKQILFRTNLHKRKHIAYKLLSAKLRSSEWLLQSRSDMVRPKMEIDDLRVQEAVHAKMYWGRYFDVLGFHEYTRRGDNVIRAVLDASSKFICAIILRWVCYHHLSPFHGFLHEPSDYPALVYDLYEPFRPLFDKVVFDVIQDNSLLIGDNIKLTSVVIERIKDKLDAKVYTEPTRQIVTYHELLHGVCLALRAYVLGEASQFIIPLPASPAGGRPKKAGYRLYGRDAGRTDFWTQARFYGEKEKIVSLY